MRLKTHLPVLITLFLPWGIFFGWVFFRLLGFSSEGSFVRHQHVWSDWGLHISMVERFARTPLSMWFDHNPAFAYGKYTYPFLVNLISGILMRAGLSLWSALIFPSLITVWLLLIGLYRLGYLVTRSRSASVLAVWIFFCSSGIKGLSVIQRAVVSGQWEKLLYLPSDPSAIPAYSWWTGNIISGMILPQRAFLLGMTIGIWSVIGLLTSTERKKPRWHLGLAGIGLGLLPIVHVHSFVVVGIIALIISSFRYRHWKNDLWYWIPAIVLATVLIFRFIFGGVSTQHFFTLAIGWNAPEGIWSWIVMWWNLWGIAIPTALISWYLLRRHMSDTGHQLAIALVLVFVFANCILMQPNSWDNSKLFAWVYLGLAWLIAPALIMLWSKNMLGKIVTLILCIGLMGTGALELMRVINLPDTRFSLNSAAQMSMAESVRMSTDPDAIFLTAPTIHEPIMDWAPRQVLMSYWAWAWNYGFDHESRANDISTMYRGGSESAMLLARYKVSYVVIGPVELHDETVNLTYFAQFPLLYEKDDYRIYDVRSLWR